jgi:hypothetical protein
MIIMGLTANSHCGFAARVQRQANARLLSFGLALACGGTQAVQGVLVKGHPFSFGFHGQPGMERFGKAEYKLAAVLAFINRFGNRKTMFKFGFNPAFHSLLNILKGFLTGIPVAHTSVKFLDRSKIIRAALIGDALNNNVIRKIKIIALIHKFPLVFANPFKDGRNVHFFKRTSFGNRENIAVLVNVLAMGTLLPVKPVPVSRQNPVRLLGANAVGLPLHFPYYFFHACHACTVSQIVSRVKRFFKTIGDMADGWAAVWAFAGEYMRKIGQTGELIMNN